VANGVQSLLAIMDQRTNWTNLSICSHFVLVMTNSKSSEESNVSHQETHRIRAEDYLRDTLARLDEESKQLLSTQPAGVRLIDIERDNVELRRKSP
jgi:hypothetical protein